LLAQVDGILISFSRETKNFDHITEVTSKGIPVILFNRINRKLEVSQIFSDDYTGAFNAVSHLVKKGRRNIFHLAGPMSISTAVDRFRGYRAALEENGLPFDENRIILWNPDKKIRTLFYRNLFLGNCQVDGIFAYDDYLAFELLQVVKNESRIMNKQLDIIGFADAPISTYISPNLTTVAQPAWEIGIQAAKEFFRQIQTKKPESRIIKLDTSLVIRGTA
jgi:LacI family transcriptional regulator/LacI family repressor for deo operon, udp, cdd, tsx, nupC, and nupG